MSDEQLKQRIRYLVEHGGIWEDPHADVTRVLRTIRIGVTVIGVLLVADMGMDWLLMR